MSFTHAFSGKSHDGVIELSEKLKEISPCPASKILFGTSGSEANDMRSSCRGTTTMRAAARRRRRSSAGCVPITASPSRRPRSPACPGYHSDFDLPIANVLHTACPHQYRYGHEGETEEQFAQRMADELEQLIIREGPDTIAAFIAEPVMGAGGVHHAACGLFREGQRHPRQATTCRFIADEVICGFGRTGNWFGTTTMGMKPAFDLHGQGHHLGLFPALGAHHRGRPLPGHAGREPQARHLRAWLHLHRPSGRLRHLAQDHRDL